MFGIISADEGEEIENVASRHGTLESLTCVQWLSAYAVGPAVVA